jgi:hypothetical protein
MSSSVAAESNFIISIADLRGSIFLHFGSSQNLGTPSVSTKTVIETRARPPVFDTLCIRLATFSHGGFKSCGQFCDNAIRIYLFDLLNAALF